MRVHGRTRTYTQQSRNVHPRVINIQETLDQILFTPAIINLGIDVLADTVAPHSEQARRRSRETQRRCSPASLALSFTLFLPLPFFAYDAVMVGLKFF